MTRSQAAAWATVAALAGATALAYLLTSVSPRLPAADSSSTLNLGAIIAFFGALLLFVSGIGTIAALPLHERWPALAGVDRRNPGLRPAPEAAVRQGILAALAVAALVLLSMLDLLDPAFVLVALLLTGLIEAFWQASPLGRH